EDRFAGPRPRWELAGATVTDDVRPYERVKLRVLNAAHSMLAYLGALAGHETIAQAVADPRLHSIVADTLERDVLPTLHAPEGMNLEQYRDQVLERFANPSLPHTTLQVAMDGSQKLPIRMLETAAECLRAGRVPHGLATGVAAWIAFIAEAMTGRFMLDDPAAEALRSAVGSPEDARERPRQVVERVSLIPGIFADEVREPRFLTAVADALRPLIPATGAA
ncbi:MAG TPA: mannitol dehydrogenase family protein, partial [Microbacteriaceae bacterium]|nr:mannitol dehydrogenase family protein [Microbacteriaceae bacterium]